MECMQAIYERRSVRKYTDEVPSCALLEEILEAGIMAPSGMNLQQWHFVMVQSPAALEECREMMARVGERFRPALEERFSRNPHIVAETGSFLKTFGGAPVMLLAFASRTDYNESLGALSGVCAAIENMLLAAHDKGLGSCWITAPLSVKMEGDFEARFAPDKGRLVACVTLGYPDESPEAPPRRAGKYEII